MKYLAPAQKAQIGRDLIKDAVVQILAQRNEPLPHAEIVKLLGIPSDFEGSNANFLSWSILGLLVNEQVVAYTGSHQSRKYFLADPQQDGSTGGS